MDKVRHLIIDIGLIGTEERAYISPPQKASLYHRQVSLQVVIPYQAPIDRSHITIRHLAFFSTPGKLRHFALVGRTFPGPGLQYKEEMAYRKYLSFLTYLFCRFVSERIFFPFAIMLHEYFDFFAVSGSIRESWGGGGGTRQGNQPCQNRRCVASKGGAN
jgi:hypothetical protein